MIDGEEVTITNSKLNLRPGAKIVPFWSFLYGCYLDILLDILDAWDILDVLLGCLCVNVIVNIWMFIYGCYVWKCKTYRTCKMFGCCLFVSKEYFTVVTSIYIYIYISTKWVTKVWNCCGNFSLSFLSLSLPHLSHGRQYLASCHSPINRDDSTIIHKSKTKKRKMPKRMLVVSTKLVNITFLELHPDEDQAISYYLMVNFQ